LATTERWDETDVERMLQPDPIAIPILACGRVHLQQYDRLLTEVRRDA
jgi:hypothetical protein